MQNLSYEKINQDTSVATLSGRLDVSVSGDIEEVLVQKLEEDNLKYILLNMEDVEYMSSSGFRVAIALLRKIKIKDGSLKMCSLKPAVKRIFDVIELTSLFEIYETEKEALDAFSNEK